MAHRNLPPLALLLAAFLELQRFPSVLLHTLGLTLLIGRTVHAYGVSQENENYKLRVLGMTLTFTTIGVSSTTLIGSWVVGR